MAYDGIITNKIANELQNLKGSRIDKIFQPSNNEILINVYNNKEHKEHTILINIDSRNYRMHLTKYNKKNPTKAPNFCMLLRKHITGLHIKNIITNNLERIIIIELEGLDEIEELINKKLIIELMGKHCNIILLDDENIIIDSLRHINNENTTHKVIPHIKYKAPINNKKNITDLLNIKQFKDDIQNASKTNENEKLEDLIVKTYNGISKTQISNIVNIKENNINEIFNNLKDIINTENTNNLDIEFTNNNKDYYLTLNNIKNIDNKDNKVTNYKINKILDKYYYEKETKEKIKQSKDNLLKKINDSLKKYKKRLSNITKKLNETKDMEKYKIYGELITANLYKLSKQKIQEITLDNYYNNNSPIKIKLDIKYTPQENAKKFYKKYNKLKNTIEICTKQKEETIKEIQYLESILYEINTATDIESIEEIKNEIKENILIKQNKPQIYNKKNNKSKKINKKSDSKQVFRPLQYKIENYTLLVGKNNKENDYLTTKYANSTDVWFHTKDVHGSHGILLVNKKDLKLIEQNEHKILEEAASIVSYHSKAQNSENVAVDYTIVKYVKKPNKSKPGMVIYTNNKTIYVKPKKGETI